MSEPGRAYLDWNATAPPLEEALAAMVEAGRVAWANPASVHADGRRARRLVEDARAEVAALTGYDPRDVVLTSGGTEANNLALRSAFAERRGGALVLSRVEHPSVLRVADALAREGLASLRWLPVGPGGVVAVEEVERALAAGDVALVALQAVNQETGALQPVADTIAACHARGVRVHVDAVQAYGRVTTEHLFGADTLAVASHKLRGPKGIGALVARPGARLSAYTFGGSQERGLRPGTVDPVACATCSTVIGPPWRISTGTVACPRLKR
jgi:cysteine desulfurase